VYVDEAPPLAHRFLPKAKTMMYGAAERQRVQEVRVAKKAAKKTAGKAVKKAAKKAVKKRSVSKRERLTTPTGDFFAKRDAEGQFSELDEVGRSLRADRARKAKKTVKAGFGDQGDRPRKATKRSAKKR
jgi:hypothetical protein